MEKSESKLKLTGKRSLLNYLWWIIDWISLLQKRISTNNVEFWRFFEVDDDEKNVLIVNGNSVIYSDYQNGLENDHEQ